MMSAPSPYPVITDTTSPLPDDAQINTVLPSICVDYLSHHWDKDEQIWASWKAMTKSKNEITNGVRLENASWRTWAKQRGKLKTISPETLNWLKDSDVTWLYGPLHEKANPVPPPKHAATFADRLGLENVSPQSAQVIATSSPALRRSPNSAPHQPQVQLGVGPERRRSRGFGPSNNRTTSAPKSILKHRTIQDMLILNIGRRAASPACQAELLDTGALGNTNSSSNTTTSKSAAALLTLPTPGSTDSSDGSIIAHTATSAAVVPEGPSAGLLCIRSDINLPESGVIRAHGPPTPTEGATDYLAAVHLASGSSHQPGDFSSSSPSSTSETAAAATAVRPSLVRTSEAEQSANSVNSSSTTPGGSRRSLIFATATEERGKRPDRHISFNHRVEQCIALDDTSSDSPSSLFAERLRSSQQVHSTPALIVPGSSGASSSSGTYPSSHSLQHQTAEHAYAGQDDDDDVELGSGDEDVSDDDDDDVEYEGQDDEGLEEGEYTPTTPRAPTPHAQHMVDDDEHTDTEYLQFKTASELAEASGSQPRVYTGSASSEEDVNSCLSSSTTSTSDGGYDSDALTMRSSSAGSISDSSTGHYFTAAREQMTRRPSSSASSGRSGSHKSGRSTKSRKGSQQGGRGGGAASFDAAAAAAATAAAEAASMHTIVKLAPTLLKTSEAYPAPSPAVVDPSNFLQTLEHERVAEQEQLRRQFGYGQPLRGGRAHQQQQPPGGGGGGYFAHSQGGGAGAGAGGAPWSNMGLYDPSYFSGHSSVKLESGPMSPAAIAIPSTSSSSSARGGGHHQQQAQYEVYGRSMPVNIPSSAHSFRSRAVEDDRGPYSVSASEALRRSGGGGPPPPPELFSHRYGYGAGSSSSSSSSDSYSRLQQGSFSHQPQYHYPDVRSAPASVSGASAPHQQQQRAGFDALGSGDYMDEHDHRQPGGGVYHRQHDDDADIDEDEDDDDDDDDDIDIDINLDMDDVDLELDLGDDDDDEDYSAASFRSYHRQFGSGGRKMPGSSGRGSGGLLFASTPVTTNKYGFAHRMHHHGGGGGEEEEADGRQEDEDQNYERMETSVDSLRPPGGQTQTQTRNAA
ncbi:hypothetical protein V8E36_007059 [Tilletia maclaganii]